MNKKQLYAAPETEVLELKLESNVLQTGSGSIPDLDQQNVDWD